MRPDPQQERMQIDDIIAGLDKIASASRMGEGTDLPHGLLALRLGCETYRELVTTPPITLIGCIPWHYNAVRDLVGYIAASMDLVRLFNHLPDKQRTKAIRQHLAIVGKGYFGIAATRTNQQHCPSVVRQALVKRGIHPPAHGTALDASRKTIELMVGMALLSHTADVSLEDSDDSSQGPPNPDVIVKHDGVRIAIACKSLSTSNPEGIRDRIREGVKQITRASMPKHDQCDTGVVLLDISALLDHDALYLHTPPHHCWRKDDIQDTIRERVMAAFARALNTEKGQAVLIGTRIGDLYEEPFTDLDEKPVEPQAEPCVLVYGHSVMIGANEIMEGPFYAKALVAYGFNDHSRVNSLIAILNKKIHGQ